MVLSGGLLNGAGRPQRDIKGWNKYWCEKKKHAKDRARDVEVDAQMSGGGQNTVRPLTDLETRVASLLGLNTIQGSAARVQPLPDSEAPPVLLGEVPPTSTCRGPLASTCQGALESTCKGPPESTCRGSSRLTCRGPPDQPARALRPQHAGALWRPPASALCNQPARALWNYPAGALRD